MNLLLNNLFQDAHKQFVNVSHDDDPQQVDVSVAGVIVHDSDDCFP